MAYCVRCGVELQKGLKSCPLCKTEVILPEEQDSSERATLFSDRMPRRMRPRIDFAPSKSFLFLATFIILLPVFVTLFIDITVNRKITWSFYPVTSLVLLWIFIVYPTLLKGHTIFQVITMDIFSTAVFLMSLDLYSGTFPEWSHYPALSLLLLWVYLAGPMLFSWRKIYLVLGLWLLGTAGFLLAIDLLTGGRDWFLPLGLPIIAILSAAGFIFAALRGLFRSRPLLAAGVTMLVAVIVIMAIDTVVNLYVDRLNLTWSPILAAVLVPTAVFLFIVNGNKDLKAYLTKKFHL